jgi:hypothetical protein
MSTFLALAIVVSTAVAVDARAAGAAQTPPGPPAAEAAAQESQNGIGLTAPDAAEAWTLSVMPLAPKDRQPASHAFLFIGILKGCTMPRAFPIVFVVDGDRTISKPGVLLSRQQADGGCVDGLATVFLEGTADAIAKAARVSIGVPNATFELSAAQLDYVRRGLARREAAPVDAAPATLPPTSAPTPVEPARRSAADEATALNERAVALVGAGRLEDARTAAEGAVAAAERAYGPDHPEVGSILVNLGMIVRRSGDNDAALTHYRRAIGLLEPKGPSQALGVVLDNLGRILQERKDLDGALAATSRAVEMLSSVVGPAHVHVGYALNNLALLWDAKGDEVKAADTCDRAIAVLVNALGPEDPRLRPFLEDQRSLRRKAGRK